MGGMISDMNSKMALEEICKIHSKKTAIDVNLSVKAKNAQMALKKHPKDKGNTFSSHVGYIP